MQPKLYVESTIPSYLTAMPSRDLIVAGHQQITREWWQKRKSDFAIYVSMMWKDHIVEEVRKVREEHAAKLNFDIKAIVEDAKKRQCTSKRKVVSFIPEKHKAS